MSDHFERLLRLARRVLEAVVQKVDQQKQLTQQVLDTIQNSLLPTIHVAWLGPDAEEFFADVGRRLVPTIVALIAAIGGINVSIQKATDIIDAADAKAGRAVSAWGDTVSKI